MTQTTLELEKLTVFIADTSYEYELGKTADESRDDGDVVVGVKLPDETSPAIKILFKYDHVKEFAGVKGFMLDSNLKKQVIDTLDKPIPNEMLKTKKS